ncbi:MAG: GNAT family N-acetyltransferase [Candidatus Promineifilaceae bacterium]|nr:GNAT family N-acetyltransferase [Candidatus Promineifilaceae bacterium]
MIRTTDQRQLRERERETAVGKGEIAMHIQPFDYSDASYEAIVRIDNAIEPENPASATGWKHFDKHREKKYHYERHIARQHPEGPIVAFAAVGETFWAHQPGKYFVHVSVDPPLQNQGIGSALYRFLRQQLTPREPRKLTAWTRENQPAALHLLNKWGFKQQMRIPVSRLDPRTFDASRFAERIARTKAAGIEIRTLRELSESDADWKRKVYELEWECLQDVPHQDEFTKQPFEQFEKRTLGSPSLLPDAWIVAVDGDAYVGLSVLWKNLATDELLETGLTGVLRSHRRLGIATAMKVRAIEYAQTHEVQGIVTDNEENNPMFQLNLQLGFKPEPAALDFAKELSA